jgi:hypothetical protein
MSGRLVTAMAAAVVLASGAWTAWGLHTGAPGLVYDVGHVRAPAHEGTHTSGQAQGPTHVHARGGTGTHTGAGGRPLTAGTYTGRRGQGAVSWTETMSDGHGHTWQEQHGASDLCAVVWPRANRWAVQGTGIHGTYRDGGRGQLTFLDSMGRTDRHVLPLVRLLVTHGRGPAVRVGCYTSTGGYTT